jgi:hypothetical protein
MLYWWGHSWETIPEENDMRLMALALAAVLVAYFVSSATAAHRYGYYRYI